MGMDAGAAKRRDLKGDARRRQILRMLEEHPSGDLSVEQIAESFGVSFATVRRDLTRLRKGNGVARTYGGVALVRPAEVPVRERRTTRRAAKEAIGRLAAGLVHPGEVIIVDAGSTTARLAAHLGSIDGLSVVTNGIGVITTLLEVGGPDVVVLGGDLRGINETITGGPAEDMLQHVYGATAFLGTDAVDPSRGLACRTLAQSRLKSLMMRRAANVVVLADSSKLGGGAFTYWSPLNRPWRLVTDGGATDEAIDRARAAGATHIDVAEVGEAPSAPGPGHTSAKER